MLASSKNRDGAQRLVAYLTGRAGQQTLADSTALEYPVAEGVAPDEALKPLSEIDAPDVDLSELNSERVITMMQDAGIL